MLVPFVGAVHRHLKSWSLRPILQCLNRFLDEPAFRRTLIKKPKAFTRPQSLYSLPVTLKTFLFQCLAQDHSCRTAVATAKDRGWLPPVPRPVLPLTVEPVMPWPPRGSREPLSTPLRP